MAKLAVLLSLQQPPTRQSLLKDCVRFGVVSVATQPLQDLHRWLEVEFHPLKVCIRVQETLKVIEDSDEKTMLAQYMQSLRDITLVRLLKQVSQVYQSICFNKLLSLAPFTNRYGHQKNTILVSNACLLQLMVIKCDQVRQHPMFVLLSNCYSS